MLKRSIFELEIQAKLHAFHTEKRVNLFPFQNLKAAVQK